MILEERMKRLIARHKNDVFGRAELAWMSSQAQVSWALHKLIAKGVLVKLGIGVYAKTKRSILSGAPIPIRPVEVLAPIALKKLGVPTYPSQRVQDYNSGATTQISAGIVLSTGNRRIVRKLGFGQQIITYENYTQIRSRTD